MKQEKGERQGEIQRSAKNFTRQDVIRRLAELACGKANDCVRLVLEEHPCLDGLDLSLLSEIRRSEKGNVEIRLLDRLRVLEQLAAMTEEKKDQAVSFLQALQGGDEA